MYGIKIEKVGNKIYVKCAKCDQILLTNDQEYSLQKIKRDELYSISSCNHFLVSEYHKDEKSLKDLARNEGKAILKYEGKYYISLIIPRKL